jgi:Flp pilus assembly protein TadG
MRTATNRSFRTNSDGYTAVEFGLIAPIFLMLLFGIMAVGLFFFTTFSLENAVDQASRLLRTGQAQTANMTRDQFKQKVCELAPGYVDCTNKMRVNVVSGPDPASLARPSCLDGGGALQPEAASQFNTGGAAIYVLVTVCYEWELAQRIPFLTLGAMANGSALIQASSAFKAEPFSSAPAG